MGKSSKDKRDAYYRLAKEQGWRARSAFKLIQIDEQFDLFSGCTRVVDLCAAPGSWSQVLSRVLIKGEKFGRQAWTEKRDREAKIIWGSDDTETDDKHKGREEEKLKHGKSLSENVEGLVLNEGNVDRISDDAKSKATRQPVRIVAIDLQPMSPLEGITILKGDITDSSTIPRILEALDPPSASRGSSTDSTPHQNPVDLVLSDGAPDVTGLHDLDIYIQSQLLASALDLTLRILKPGGKFVAKIFRGKDCDLIYSQLRCFFKKVSVAKPRSSRASSLEAFIVAEGFMGIPKGYEVGELGSGQMLKTLTVTRPAGEKNGFVDGQKRYVRDDGVTVLELEPDSGDEIERNRWIAPFVACGDLSAFDADASYHLPKDRVSLDPVQPPTAPPYKRALELRRQQGGLYGKTGKAARTNKP